MAAGATYEPIATTTLGSAQASVTFNSFSGYTDLFLVVNATSTANNNMDLRFNSDSASNYSRTVVLGDGSTASSNRASSQTFIRCTSDGIISTGSSMQTVNIMNYANSTTYKTTIGRANNAAFGTDAIVGLWRSTAAITSLTLTLSTNNFSAGSTFTLYGIAAA